MAKLKCPNKCKSNWTNATQIMDANGSTQKATCASCGTVVTSKGGVIINKVDTFTQIIK